MFLSLANEVAMADPKSESEQLSESIIMKNAAENRGYSISVSKGEQWLSQGIALEDIGSRYFDKKEKVPKELLGHVCIAGKWFHES